MCAIPGPKTGASGISADTGTPTRRPAQELRHEISRSVRGRSQRGASGRDRQGGGILPLVVDASDEFVSDHGYEFGPITFDLEGVVEVILAETGESCVLRKGSRLGLGAGVTHRKNSAGGRAVIGVSAPPETLSQPINKTATAI